MNTTAPTKPRPSRAPAKPDDYAARIAAMTAREIAAGRHAPIEQWRTTCQGCGGQVNGNWMRAFDGKYLCVVCASRAGDALAVEYLLAQARRAIPADATAGQRWTLMVDGEGGPMFGVEVAEVKDGKRILKLVA